MNRYVTHLICSKCGADIRVIGWAGMTEADQDTSPIRLTEFGLDFHCPACGAVYPLPVAREGGTP